MFELGIARHSMHRIDALLHLLAPSAQWPSGFATWCGGGPAMKENTVTQRRCRRCMALARADLVEGNVQPDEPSDLDWFLGRQVPRQTANNQPDTRSRDRRHGD